MAASSTRVRASGRSPPGAAYDLFNAPRGIEMRAWTVDADDIRVAEDFNDSLLHHTPEIDAFLRSDRDDKFIVIGTKGFGKTLLLKVKRILYQREGRAACLPTGVLLDKPIGDKIFSRELLAFFVASPLPWSKIWLTAIALATLKHLRAVGDLKVGQALDSLVADEQLQSVIDHFVRLLDFTPRELQRCSGDTDGHLVPRLRAVSSPVALFIDGVDEYFNKHVEARPDQRSVTGELSPNVWHFAQLGLVEVAYSTAKNQPSHQGICRGAQGGVCAARQDDRNGSAVSRQRCRYRLLTGQFARDIRQQCPLDEDRHDGEARASAKRSAPGFRRPNSRY
jgi:hypothetical protein